MTYTPQRSTFLLPQDHPDHPLQVMLWEKARDAEQIQYRQAQAKADQGEANQGEEDPTGPIRFSSGELDGNPTDCLCEQLILLSAFTHELQMQAHLLHLNYVGSNFLAVHAFLKDRYEAHIDQFDTIAEFVRALGKPMPATHAELLKILPAFEHAMSTAECQLSNYAENLAHQACMATALESAATERAPLNSPGSLENSMGTPQRQIDVANYMAELVADTGKTRWFITATLS
jgi:DNA-binding ferritin-like protein